MSAPSPSTEPQRSSALQDEPGAPVEAAPPVVIVAMDDEAAPFLALADSIGAETRVGNAWRRRIRVSGHTIDLIRSGIGLVNAAGAATAAILLAAGEHGAGAPAVVISAGSAGGVGTEVRVGEVIVGTEYVNTAADARAFGYALGQSPGMPARYHATESVLALASGLAAEPSAPRIRHGLIVSSDTFVTDERVDPLRADFAGALATDMESLAIAQVAHSHGVPFVSIRGISDLCGPSEFEAHVDDAAERSAAVVLALLDALAEERASLAF